MKDKHHICLIMPQGYIHAMCFREIASLLKSSLTSIGIECSYAANQLAADRINVVLGYHLLKFNQSLLKCRYIPYQLEQLDATEGWYSENIRRLLENAYQVWDYSKENIQFLKGLNIEAKHLPIGYHRDLELIRHADQKDIDILFYGSVGERRKAVLDRLNTFANVKVLFGVYEKQRDDFIARSKIVLNIHHYSTKIFEAPRISYLLNNACFVVSEASFANPYKSVGLCLVPYEELAETCRFYLAHTQEIDRLRQDTYARFKENYPMVDFVRDVV